MTLPHSFHIVVDKNGEYAFDVVEGFTLNRFRADIYGQALIDDLTEEQKNGDCRSDDGDFSLVTEKIFYCSWTETVPIQKKS